MKLYLKLGILVYCLILPIGFTVSQLHAGGKLKGDYVAAIRNGPVSTQRRPPGIGYYTAMIYPSELFTFRARAQHWQHFHHSILYQAGRVELYKECPDDIKGNDPVENSCQTIWARI